MSSNKLVVILGPTACGKTKLAAGLAGRFNGEIVSADSRQVYRGMDIGTGKDLADYRAGRQKILYHLIDIISPKTAFSVAKYQLLAYQAINRILERGKLPILAGGTGLYLDAVIFGYQMPAEKGDAKIIRKKLEKLTLPRLLARLKAVDAKTYKIIDRKNRRRVQRALEIFYATGRPKSAQLKKQKPPYQILVLGVKFPLEKIYERIDRRLEKRINEGMIQEVKKLRQRGVSWKRLDEFGLEYRWVSRYLRGQIDYQAMVAELKKAIHHFAKRQLTWFKRNPDIVWVENKIEAQKKIEKFMRK